MQGAALAALAALVFSFSRNARLRYAVGVLLLLLMVATPVATFQILRQRTLEPPPSLAPPSSASAVNAPFPGAVAMPAAQAASENLASAGDLVWLVEAWFLVVLLFSIRTFGGILVLDLGLKTDSDDLIGMKVQGITPEYIQGIRATGLNPDTDGLIGMKVQGVTPEYIKALQSAGLKLDVEDVIGAKVQGVTPEFIEKARSHGFKDLNLDKLITLKHSGVLE